MLLTLASAAGTGALADLPGDYLEVLRAFEPYAESVWQDTANPPDSGYFGDGRSGGNGGIRGTCGIALAYATLFRADSPTDHRRERLIRALRYAAGTHRTGTDRCVDGQSWGASWQSSLWAGSLGCTAVLMREHLPEDVLSACRRAVADEADARAAIAPASGFRGDSKAEENAWNSNVLCLAAAWLRDDPRREAWLDAARRYLANTYTAPDSAEGTLGQWITTQTLTADFACENHGFFHPSYLMVSGMSLGDSWIMAALADPATAAALAPFAEHNVLPAWDCASALLLDSGETAYPAGLDWALHGYGQVSYLAWIGRHFDDPTARWAENRVARLLRQRQDTTDDGRFTGDSVADGFYREAVMARRLALAYWHHRLARFPNGIERPPGSRIHHLPHVGVLVQRSRRGFASLSYGSRTMAMVLPAAAAPPESPFVVTPRVPGLITLPPFPSAGDGTRLLRCRADDTGFDAEILLPDALSGPTRVRMVSVGDAVALIEAPGRPFLVPEEGTSVFPVGIENHTLTGGERRLVWEGGGTTVPALSGRRIEAAGSWVWVSGGLGVAVGPGLSLRYTAADRFNRSGAAEDTLDAVTPDPSAARWAVLFPGCTPAETGSLAGEIRWEQDETGSRLLFHGPESGEHRIEVQTGPAPDHPEFRRVPVQRVRAGTESERHPATLAADGDPATFWVSSRGARPGDGPTPERPEWLEVTFEGEADVSHVMLLPRPRYGPRNWVLLADGRPLRSGTCGHEPMLIDFERTVRCRALRLQVVSAHDPAHPTAPRNCQVAEFLTLCRELE
ncbi:MAG: discoidin domain-containing protein [Lentisphaeria bacterium]|nr:discoidin domain-containing protein [Lentisphaeria bacterium]